MADTNDSPPKFQKVKYQYMAILCVNIISFCHGSCLGWMSPSIPVLQAADTPLQSGPVTVEQISWIGSSVTVGSVVGNILFAILLKYTGLRRSLISLAFPNILFWLSIILATNPTHLYIGRFLGGITAGGLYLCIPSFVADVADPKIRGKLGSFLVVILMTGMLASFVAGTYLPYTTVPFVFISIPVVYSIGFYFFPETMQQYLKQGNIQAAEKSYTFYRLGNEFSEENKKRVTEEVQLLQAYLQLLHDQQDSTKVWNVLRTWSSIKGILIGICLTFLNLFSGTLAMMSYTTMVFKESGSTVDSHRSAIVMIVIQVVSVYISSLLVDHVGRRTLLICSTSGAAMACAGLGIFSYLHHHHENLSAFNWVPMFFFSMYVVTTCMGILPLPFIILAEILPADIRQIGCTICMLSISVFAFITLKTFPVITVNFGLFTTLWICAGVCVLGLLFAIFILQETKGKNLNAIAKKLSITYG